MFVRTVRHASFTAVPPKCSPAIAHDAVAASAELFAFAFGAFVRHSTEAAAFAMSSAWCAMSNMLGGLE